MEKDAFDRLFEDRVAGRLAKLGFTSKGRTLFVFNSKLTMSLVRLGGRMSSAGHITHILCFRHSFLRDRTEQVPTTTPSDVFDYPYKFRPIQDADGELVYRPQNLNFQYERLRWEGASESSVDERLDRIASNVEHRFLPWASTLSLASARSEIADRGEQAWCERMWIEDYDAQLAPDGG